MASEGIFPELSDDLLSVILCFLTLKQRATTSLVSKKWHEIITSLIDKKFIQIQCANRYASVQSAKKISDVHIVVKLATNNTDLTEFYLFLTNPSIYFKFSLKNLETRFLTFLHLQCCTVDDEYIYWFPCLKEMCFDRVYICTETLSKFIRKCPSIVEVSLIRCCYLYSILVPHRDHLRKVRVNYDNRYLKQVVIKARNLIEFHLLNSSLSLQVDLRACTKLQILKLDCRYIPIGFPEDISLEFSCLKSLSLRRFKKLKKFILSSGELENLTLSDMPDLDDPIIDTPNLRSFKLINIEKVPSWCPVVGLRLMEVEIGLTNVQTTNSLRELRIFTENLGGNITLSFDTTELKEVISHSQKRRNNIEPLIIKHITFGVHSSVVPRYESLIDELFSYFYPRTLRVRVDSDVLSCKFKQVLLDELKRQKTKCSKRYERSDYLCWRDALKSIEILESITTTKEGAHQLSLELDWYFPYKRVKTAHNMKES